MTDDLTKLTIAEAAERIRRREVSPVELTEAYLARIDRHNPSINAYVTVTAGRARSDAAPAEKAIAAGEYRGPLHGIPIGLKDLYDTAGIETAGGSKILSGIQEAWPALALAWLIALFVRRRDEPIQ